MDLNNIAYQCLSTLTTTTFRVTTFSVGLTSGENLSKALPCEPPPRLHYESFVELTAPWEPHLHFTTFKNSISVQKTGISKTAWMNPSRCMLHLLHKRVIFSLSITILFFTHRFWCCSIKHEQRSLNQHILKYEFVFGSNNVHDKEWLIFSTGTNTSGELRLSVYLF